MLWSHFLMLVNVCCHDMDTVQTAFLFLCISFVGISCSKQFAGECFPSCFGFVCSESASNHKSRPFISDNEPEAIFSYCGNMVISEMIESKILIFYCRCECTNEVQHTPLPTTVFTFQ